MIYFFDETTQFNSENINFTKLLVFYFENSILLGNQTYNITNIQSSFA